MVFFVVDADGSYISVQSPNNLLLTGRKSQKKKTQRSLSEWMAAWWEILVPKLLSLVSIKCILCGGAHLEPSVAS